MPLKNSNQAHCRVVPSGVEIDKPLPQREPSSSISPSLVSLLPPSAADNSPRLAILQTVPPRKRELHSAWSVAHSVTTFFFSQLELLVETLDCSQRIIHFALDGDPVLVLLFPQFQRHIIQHLGKFML